MHPLALIPEKPNDGSPIRWTDCEDLIVRTDAGEVVHSGPKWYRCKAVECNSLVTHGMVHQGGCFCGNRRVGPALRLTTEEKSLLKRGYYPLCTWEHELVQPMPPPEKGLGWGKADWLQRHT